MEITNQDIIIQKLKAFSEDAEDQLIKDQISSHQDRVSEIEDYREQFKGEHDILERPKKGTRPNNKIPVNYQKYTLKIAKNYLLANSPTYKNKLEEDEDSYNEVQEFLEELAHIKLANNDHKHIKKIFEDMSATKEAFEYVYLSSDRDIKYTTYKPENCIPIYNTKGELQLVIRYFNQTYFGPNGDEIKKTKVEIYDDEKVQYFISGPNNNYILDQQVKNNPYYHHMDRVPIIHYQNDDGQSDFDDIKELVKQFEHRFSDGANELNYSALSYLVLLNAAFDYDESEYDSKEEALAAMASQRLLELLNQGDGENEPDAKFLTKDIPTEAQENFFNRAEDLIFTLSCTPKIFKNSDEVSNLSGKAIERMYAAADIKADEKEEILVTGIRKRLQLIYKLYKIKDKSTSLEKDILNQANKDRVWNYINLNFDRNKIINRSELINDIIASKTGGSLSQQSAVEKNPLVDDPEKELARIKDEVNARKEEINHAMNDES